jgi:hypothetical protein
LHFLLLLTKTHSSNRLLLQLPTVLQHMDPKLIEAIETEIMQDMDRL